MSAHEWFESIQRQQALVDKLREQVESAYAAAGPHGQQIGSVGGGGGKYDSLTGIDGLIDSDTCAKLDAAQASLKQMMNRATDVLYGKSGRGGLAKARSSTDADILCCHYLQGMGWAEIASDIARKDCRCPDDWCRMRAMRAFTYIDRFGEDNLAES